MAVSNFSGLTVNNPQTGIQFTKVTDTSADWASVPNSTYFYDKATALTYFKTNTGSVLQPFSTGTAFSSTQWSKTLAAPVNLPDGTIANGFTFLSDATDRVANGCTAYNEFFISSTRRLNLTGTSGTANVNVGGTDYLMTFTLSLAATAVNFVATYEATIFAAHGVRIAASPGGIKFGHLSVAVLNAITITNVTPNLSGTFTATVGDHVVIPYTNTVYNGQRLQHNFRVNFGLAIGSTQTLALSLRRWVDDSIIGSEIPIFRNADVSGHQENFISYTAGATDPFVLGGFYFALRNDSGTSIMDVEGNVGILIQNYFQNPINF
jgi:hypothetical protein